jgi:hypothetical protein
MEITHAFTKSDGELLIIAVGLTRFRVRAHRTASPLGASVRHKDCCRSQGATAEGHQMFLLSPACTYGRMLAKVRDTRMHSSGVGRPPPMKLTPNPAAAGGACAAGDALFRGGCGAADGCGGVRGF